MKILFIHRSFPAQFKYLAAALAINPKNIVVFITEDEKNEIKGVNKVLYEVKDDGTSNCHPYLKNYTAAVSQGINVAAKAMALKEKGFIPDVIYGFSGWGCSMFIKEVFPDVPFICYCEWYLNPEGGKIGFAGEKLSIDERVQLRCDNTHVLSTLSLCDAGVAPTQWQKKQFPKEFQEKIKVIHDGIDIATYKPNKEAKFIVQDKNLELTTEDEVITYGTRGFEPCRGFPELMETVSKLLKKRPKAHFLIAGENTVYYSPEKKTDYKALMLEKFDIDLERVHFVGTLPQSEYLKFLQVSSAHIYLTYPFVLSWSVLEAMSTGCCLVASDTAPVLEAIQDNYNGLLTDFFDTDKLVEKVEYALDNMEKMQEIRNNARKTIVENFDLLNVVAKHFKLLEELKTNADHV